MAQKRYYLFAVFCFLLMREKYVSKEAVTHVGCSCGCGCIFSGPSKNSELKKVREGTRESTCIIL